MRAGMEEYEGRRTPAGKLPVGGSNLASHCPQHTRPTDQHQPPQVNRGKCCRLATPSRLIADRNDQPTDVSSVSAPAATCITSPAGTARPTQSPNAPKAPAMSGGATAHLGQLGDDEAMLLRVPVLLNGHPVPSLMDTAASHSYISAHLVPEGDLEPYEGTALLATEGTSVPTAGCAQRQQ
ncbi:uncharacterized protein LOC134541024 isoform X1 [Bacillus rossius redtenbacheri]|uniref:uncharacterized protein LOC134541024 isoform X1 n=1 Tax=Bacillus rossius redtenbacheri TaxID=93214 RepID=UPI002FDD5007